MNKTELLKRIALKAKQDKKNRKDARYLETMGFLTAKGFLATNEPIVPTPNKRVHLADAIWAGLKVEPRILEVLPAAVLRLPNHFDLDRERFPELYAVVENLRKGHRADPIWGITYEKYRVWIDLPLRDKRVKDLADKKITKTFRLTPDVVTRIKEKAKQMKCTETDVIERAFARS